jgi:PAS domain S-box-containing protein
MPEEHPTVLVVDDDPQIRDSIGELLRSLGINTRLFASVSDFLKSEMPEGPACLVLDVRLPGRSGLEFQRALAAANRKLPIVFITGHGDIPMSVQAMKGGAIEFLTKPFRDQDLVDAIQLGLARVTEKLTAQPDITALTIAEERYRALVRATSSLVWTTAPDGQIVDMPEWRAYTGESVEQIKGWGWLNSLHPDDRERTAVVWQQAVDTRSFYETEYRIRRSDGVYVWHRARGVPVLEADGSIREWVGICLDITQRRQAEEKRIEAETALRRLNETLEQRVQAETRERLQIWNVSQDLLVIVGLDGKYLSVNPAWTATLGWSEADLLGKSSQWLLHPDDRESTRAEVDRLAKGHKTLRFENRLRAKDGSYHWISWKAAPDSGRIYSMGRDITELKRAEERLRVQHTVAQILAEAATIEEATPRILLAIGECLGWDVGGLWRVDREAEVLRCVELWHEASIEVPEFERVSRAFTFGPGLGLPGRVWSSLEPEYIPDVVPDENFPRAPIAQREGLHAAFGFPILLGGKSWA